MAPLGGLLIEREPELVELDESIRSAKAGEGGMVVVEGPAGIGKTSLLDEACSRAAAGGMTVLRGQGAMLERDFGFGVVRQLFEPVIAGASRQVRSRLLAGAAALATPVVAPDDVAAAGGPPSQQLAVVHGLFWVTANLTDLAPLLIAVDDVQWSDSPSLYFLNYVARRLIGVAVLLLIALRTGDLVEAPLLQELRSYSGAQLIQPQPLSLDGVGQVVRSRFGASAEDSFVEACRTASGGVPFLLRELVAVLSADRVPPTAESISRVAMAGPQTVAHATILRLSRLSTTAGAVAGAVAVLGRQARLDRIAALAGVDLYDTRAAVDALIGMEILARGQPVRFAHPLVHQAIYDDLPPTERADAHARAGRILAAENAPIDEVAAHLLLSEPMGRPDVVEMLHAAARQAVARGAPQSAAAYLRRALAEGAAEADRVALLHELGGVEAVARDPRAAEHLEAAMRLAGDPSMRARIGWELSEVYLLSGQWSRRLSLLQGSLSDLGDREPDLAARIEAARSATEFYDPRFASEFESRLPHLRLLVERGGPAPRALALVLAAMFAVRCTDREQVLALVEQGLDGGRLLQDEGSECLAIPQAVVALGSLDKLGAADEATKDVLDDARRRGSVMGYLMGSGYRLWVDAKRGALKDAEGHFRAAFDVAKEHGLTFALPTMFFVGVDVLLERPQLEDVAGLVESIELEPAFAATVSGAWVMTTRGRLRFLRGERESAVADLRAAGEIFDACEFSNPIMALWRSPLALALPSEALVEARTLVEEELQLAVSAGLFRAQGVALRAAGSLEGGERGIELLKESLVVLQHPEARLEKARTLVELGAALQRANQRVAAREPLRAGLELAHRCGAERLAQRAAEELRICGARPRRPMVSGPEALTSSEARVARMAADGMTNREIAQSLFVTAKTVENQLGTTYQKLGVSSRSQLRTALRGAD